MKQIDIKKLNIPDTPGCYKFYNKGKEIIYIGKASSLKKRVCSYWRKSANHSPAKALMMTQVRTVDWVETDSEIEALLLESNLIKKYQPHYNILLRDDKRFSYIKISTEDEIPGIFITREIGRSGKYFGPFVSAGAARETIRAIRKIWPYCTQRKAKEKSCFNYHINRCLGVCSGVVSRKEYEQKVIRPISLFFEGKKKRVVMNLKKEINKLKKQIGKNTKHAEEEERELNVLTIQLKNISHVLECTKIISLSEKYVSDVIELAKVLGLPRVPKRIEGYDISSLFENEAVGSMVVFVGGEPMKSEYRKFKIKNPDATGDTGMLKEVLTRRFKRSDNSSVKNSWQLPDIIIVDGGRAQLGVVTRILKKFRLNKAEGRVGIPVLSIAKGDGLRSSRAMDKLFFPGSKNPLELSLSSPALHLVKRVRDEAHRFAIEYHRKLRKKSWLTK